VARVAKSSTHAPLGAKYGPADPVFMRLRAFCAALPGTREDHPWGHPHWKVADKIFFGYGEEDGLATVGFKTEKEQQRALVDMDPRFSVAPYVGKHGWVSMKIDDGEVDWPELEALIIGSYRMIAPAKLVAALDGGAGPAPAKAKAKKPAARAKKPAARAKKPVARAKPKPAARAKKAAAAKAKPAARSRSSR
jgi:predicted DNA-binding protein (MmcQ/YjbR family)